MQLLRPTATAKTVTDVTVATPITAAATAAATKSEKG